MAVDPNMPPPIDPSIAGAPTGNAEAPWVPPWLQQQVPVAPQVDPQQLAAPPPAPAEIQMPDDYVGNAPAAQQPAMPPGVAPDAMTGAAPVDPHLQYLAAINAPPSIEAMQTPNEHAAAVAGNATLPLEQRAQALDESTLSPIQRADVLAKMPAEQLAALALQEQARKIHEQSARDLEAARANDEAARREYAMHQAATAQANAGTADIAKEAANIANTKIVTPGGAGFTVLSMLGGALGGLAAKGAGLSSNPFMDGLNKGIEQSIAIQKDEIQNRWKGLDVRKNLLAEQYQRTGDLYKASQVVRIAHLDSAIKQSQILAQDYDPNGTTAIAIAQQTQQIQAARVAALAATNQTLFKNHLEQQKADNDAATLAQTVKHQNDETAIGWMNANTSRMNANAEADKNTFAKQDQQPIPMELLAARHPGSPMPPANMFPQGMSEKQYGMWLESQNKGLESQGKETENAQKLAAGQVRDINGNPAVDDKGKIIQVEPKAAETANHLRAKGQQALDALSAARRLLASDPSTVDRATWLKVKNDLINGGVALAGTLGEKTSPRAIEETLKLVGDDYDSYTKRYLNKGEGGAGVQVIDNEIDTLKRNLDTEVKTTTGIKTSAQFFDTSKPPPTQQTPEDKLTKVLSTNYAKVFADEPDSLDADDRAFQQITRGTNLNPALTAGLVNEHFSPIVNRALQAGIAPAQQRALDALQAAVRGSDQAARAEALRTLAAISGVSEERDGKRPSATGANANVRTAAKAIIDEGAASVRDSVLNAADQPGPEVH